MKTTWTKVCEVFPGGVRNGDWYNIECILCHRENKLGITLEPDGTMHANCFVCADDGKHDDVYDTVREALEEGKPVESGNAPVKIKQHTFRFSEGQLKCAEAALDYHPEAIEYLQSRGINVEVAKRNRVGYVDHWRIGPAVVMPSFDDQGELVEVKFRSIKGKEFDKTNRTPGEHWLYSRDVVPEAVLTGKPVVVTESQLDALTLQSFGFPAVSFDSAAHKLNAADLCALKSLPLVALGLDNDEAGQEATERTEKLIPAKQRITLDFGGTKDLGEVYNAAPEQFAQNLQRIIRTAQLLREAFTFEDCMTASELLTLRGAELLYAVDKLIPLNRITLLYGLEKVGKSVLALYLCFCVANGRKAFRTLTTRKMPVLYLDYEDGVEGSYISFMQHLGSEEPRLRTSFTGLPALDDPYLLELCRVEKPLLVIDSLHILLEMAKANAWKSDDVTPVLSAIRKLKRAGATIIILHHSPKDRPEEYRDSGVIGADCDFRLAVVAREDQGDGVKRVQIIGKPSRGAQPPTLNLITFPHLSNPEIGEITIEDKPPISPLDQLVDFIRGNPMNQTALEKNYKPNGKGMRADTLRKLIRTGIDKGVLECGDRGVLRKTNSGPSAGRTAVREMFPPHADGIRTDGFADAAL